MHTIRLVFFALALLMTSAQAAECERPARLHFSLAPQSDLQKDVASLKPLFADLQAALGIPVEVVMPTSCLLYTSPSPRDLSTSRMPSSA